MPTSSLIFRWEGFRVKGRRWLPDQWYCNHLSTSIKSTDMLLWISSDESMRCVSRVSCVSSNTVEKLLLRRWQADTYSVSKWMMPIKQLFCIRVLTQYDVWYVWRHVKIWCECEEAERILAAIVVVAIRISHLRRNPKNDHSAHSYLLKLKFQVLCVTFTKYSI